MQRILNDPDLVVEQMLEGYVKKHAGLVQATENSRVLKYVNAPIKGKVGVVTGGGSGHEPAFLGYVGRNLLDSVAVGEIFSSPSAKAFADAFRAADSGEGVACLYGNYAGDNMNVKMAVKMVAKANVAVKTVVANDDVASAPIDQREKRRGVAGEIFMWKCGGAKAALGASLDEVIATAQKTIDNCRSVGVGLTSCTIPALGHPNFSIEDGKMELGIGHHGEPGIQVVDLESAAEMARHMVTLILEDLPYAPGEETAVLISGLGATPLMEQYIFYNEVEKLLTAREIKIHRSYVGNYFTSLEMMGITLTLLKLDDEIKDLLDMECESVGMAEFGKGGRGNG